MSAFAGTQARHLYGNPARATMSDRTNEADLFRRSIADLREIAKSDEGLTPQKAEKLSRNLSLWDALCVDLVSLGNSLPDELKNSLIDLGNFVRQHTINLYSGRGDVDVLIDINVAILKGLEARSAREAA